MGSLPILQGSRGNMRLTRFLRFKLTYYTHSIQNTSKHNVMFILPWCLLCMQPMVSSKSLNGKGYTSLSTEFQITVSFFYLFQPSLIQISSLCTHHHVIYNTKMPFWQKWAKFTINNKKNSSWDIQLWHQKSNFFWHQPKKMKITRSVIISTWVIPKNNKKCWPRPSKPNNGLSLKPIWGRTATKSSILIQTLVSETKSTTEEPLHMGSCAQWRYGEQSSPTINH